MNELDLLRRVPQFGIPTCGTQNPDTQNRNHLLNEDDLIRKSQQGDKASFESLLRLWARPIYAWLLPHVKDVHRAEDMTQETLLRAWKSIKSLDDPAKFKGWIFSIAQRTLIDQTRFDSRKRRSRLRTEYGETDTISSTDATDPRQEVVLEALNRLPTAYRDVLSQRFLSGLSPGEIEQRLNITNGSFRGLLHRGLKMLRDELEPFDESIQQVDTPIQEIKP